LILRKWEDLPDNMKNDSVREYYDALNKKKSNLFAKRIFDVTAGLLTFIVTSPVFIILSIAIKIDSQGPVVFQQTRVTQYGRQFQIYKFRTMVDNAEKFGTQVTTKSDARVTKVGGLLRKFRLDELPQLINIISGDMTFVGTRPEVPRYVEQYTQEMMATLLLPAGVTSEASIRYKDEERLLSSVEDADKTYVEVVLPDKMKFNLSSLKNFSSLGEMDTMFRTVAAVVKRDE